MEMSWRQGSGWMRQQLTNSFLTSFFACRSKEIRNLRVTELEFVTAFNYQKHSAEAVQQILKRCPSLVRVTMILRHVVRVPAMG